MADSDGATVVDANFTVSTDGADLIASALLPSGATPTFVDYQLTDFPLCTYVDAGGLSVGPFGPLPVGGLHVMLGTH